MFQRISKLLLLLALLWPGAGWGATAYVNSNHNRAFSPGTTIAVTVTGVTNGNALSVWVAWDSSTITLNSITDDKSNSYTLVQNPTTSGAYRIGGGYAVNVTGGTVVITATFSSGPGIAIIDAHESSGVATSSALDVSNAAGSSVGAGTDSLSISITTTQTGDYIHGFAFNTSQNGTVSAGTNYTGRQTFAGNNGASESRVYSSSGAVNVLFTTGAFDNHIIGAMALKEAGGGGGGTANSLMLMGVGK